jgi:hypothetical protein
MTHERVNETRQSNFLFVGDAGAVMALRVVEYCDQADIPQLLSWDNTSNVYCAASRQLVWTCVSIPDKRARAVRTRPTARRVL